MSGAVLAKGVYEQAFVFWVDLFNQRRVDELLVKLEAHDVNLEKALRVLDECKKSIGEEVVKRNRGGNKGMHGFIGERIQVALKNADSLLENLPQSYQLIDNNGRDDYLRGLTPIQQKCVQRKYGLDAIRKHLEMYPNFLDDSGVYQIPRDYYDKLKSLWSLSQEEAGKLSKSDYHLWKSVQAFSDKTDLSPNKIIEPMEVSYNEVQKNTYEKVITEKKEDITKRNKDNRKIDYQKSKPTMKEAGKAAAVGAGVEGAIFFLLAVARKHKAGKRLCEYTKQDWKDVGIDTGYGVVEGGTRGGAIYVLSNFTCTPANVASALVTAVFGTVTNARKYSKGEISQEDFIINSEACCMDAGISAVAALVGEMVIPIPVLGAIIGSSVGIVMSEIAKKYCDSNVQKCIAGYHSEIEEVKRILDKKYQIFFQKLEHEFKRYKTVLQLAFDEDVNIAFDNSILLAQLSGVEEGKILKSRVEIDAFFMS